MLKIRPEKTPNTHWYGGLFVLFLSITFFCFAFSFGQSEYRFEQSATRAKGVVINQDSGNHHVTIEFATPDGKDVKYPQSGHVSYDVGEHVTVLYEPTDPSHTAKTDAIGSVYADAIGMCIFGCMALILALLTIYFPQYIVFSGASNKKG